jgi:hypothetical protein
MSYAAPFFIFFPLSRGPQGQLRRSCHPAWDSRAKCRRRLSSAPQAARPASEAAADAPRRPASVWSPGLLQECRAARALTPSSSTPQPRPAEPVRRHPCRHRQYTSARSAAPAAGSRPSERRGAGASRAGRLSSASQRRMSGRMPGKRVVPRAERSFCATGGVPGLLVCATILCRGGC